jgi:hypothetical protein
MADEVKGAGKAAPSKEPKGEKKPTYEVVTDFRDINDFSQTHYAGSDVSYFDKKRLEKLIDLGYVKQV